MNSFLIRFFSKKIIKPDFGLLIPAALIIIIGIIAQYSSAGASFFPYSFRSTVVYVFSSILFLFPTHEITKKSKIIVSFYGSCIIVLIFLLLFGSIKVGVARWVAIGYLSVQPSELSKISIIMILPYYLKKYGINKKSYLLHFIIPCLIISLPSLLVLKQPNLGTFMVMISVGASIIIASGFSLKKIIFMSSGALLSIPIAWKFILCQYQKNRILFFINPELDPLGNGYNAIQSKIAVGSGGIFGKGIAKGTQTQLNFLPEKNTDFIFTVISEELGFIGSTTVLVLYFFLIKKILQISYKSDDIQNKLMAIGISTLFAFHMIVNIGMTIGIMPITGIPLPLLSYGRNFSVVTIFLLSLVNGISADNKQI